VDDVESTFFGTPLLGVLNVLLRHTGIELSDSEVAEKVRGAGRSAVHQALQHLARMGVVRRTNRGRRCFNVLDNGHAWIQPLKVTLSIMDLAPLVEFLKEHATKIVLFGSRADGTYRADSDYDVLVVSSDPEAVHRLAAKMDFGGRLQLLVRTPSEMLDFSSNDPVLAANIRKGAVLWER
jgi:predicted nucleotidyltransferase